MWLALRLDRNRKQSARPGLQLETELERLECTHAAITLGIGYSRDISLD
jgi:hypothetical protein